MSDRVENAVELGREYLKNSSVAGEEKLQQFIVDEYGKLSRGEFRELIDQMTDSPENQTSSGRYKDTLSIYSEDANHDGFIEIPEIWTTQGGMTHEMKMPEAECSKSGGRGSNLENATRNVLARKALLKGEFKEFGKLINY